MRGLHERWYSIASLTEQQRRAVGIDITKYPWNMVADSRERVRRNRVPHESEGRPDDFEAYTADGVEHVSFSCREAAPDGPFYDQSGVLDDQLRTVTIGGSGDLSRDDLLRLSEWLPKARAWIDLAFETRGTTMNGANKLGYFVDQMAAFSDLKVVERRPGVEAAFVQVAWPDGLVGHWEFDASGDFVGRVLVWHPALDDQVASAPRDRRRVADTDDESADKTS